jgi:hypothetical protein
VLVLLCTHSATVDAGHHRFRRITQEDYSGAVSVKALKEKIEVRRATHHVVCHRH